ncbi:MAG: hypothetical protein HC929_06450 [Leptolyngbyaceae cyanobacterium SM2_5_2]|nr:hypothetical protein [Leptolyngbyaceae cyanobacterium SM2_5_2]
MLTVKGRYENGEIHLLESAPPGKQDVLVIFLDAPEPPHFDQMMVFGMFSGGHQSTEEDFHIAEFFGILDDSLTRE